MNKKDITDFFDKCAPDWDNEMIIDTDVVNRILDLAQIKENCRVLDVASGTGVLFPFYEARKAACVVGIDVSPEMVKIAKKKFPHREIICADAENYEFDREFDSVMIYNAFPHFAEPEKLIENLLRSLTQGGRFSVAHGMSKEKIDKCHRGAAASVSLSLPEADKLKEIFQKYLDVDVVISDDRMYMVSGVKR